MKRVYYDLKQSPYKYNAIVDGEAIATFVFSSQFNLDRFEQKLATTNTADLLFKRFNIIADTRIYDMFTTYNKIENRGLYIINHMEGEELWQDDKVEYHSEIVIKPNYNEPLETSTPSDAD